MRVAIYHRYDYPNLLSRIKTYIAKIPILRVYDGKFIIVNIYGGLYWSNIETIEIGRNNSFKFLLEINELEWCNQRELLIIRELL